MSLLDRLWQAESLLAHNPEIDFLDHFPDLRSWPETDLVELVALQLSRGTWYTDRIHSLGNRFECLGLPTSRLPEVIRLAYRNRIVDRTAGEWSNVAELGIPHDTLRLQGEGECGWLGQTVQDRYRLEARIGRGALAVVYRASDRATGAIVALKLPVHVSLCNALGPIFYREAEATQQIEHTRVPRILACHDKAPIPFVVVQFVAGDTLAAWQSGRVIPPDQATSIVLQILEPLEIAHQLGVIHRDLTPTNILVGPDQCIFVTDWNASLREHEMASRDGDCSGTPGYASQEGLFGLTSRIDPRSDLWSVGALLFELLTGQRFDAVANREEAIVHSAFLDPEMLPFPDAVPDRLRRICRKAVQPNPLRYGTAAEFRAALLDPEVPLPQVRWIDVFEMGHLLGKVRRCWMLFVQQIRLADQSETTRERINTCRLASPRWCWPIKRCSR